LKSEGMMVGAEGFEPATYEV